MGKTILVMDMPKACVECPLSLEIEGVVGAIICRGCEKYSVNNNCTEKPDWCPLKEIPEKKEITDYRQIGIVGYYGGWNDCIDEILKGSGLEVGNVK